MPSFPRITVTTLPRRESPELFDRLMPEQRDERRRLHASADRWEWDGLRWTRRPDDDQEIDA